MALTTLDLVVVASPNRTHVPVARAALDAGLPVVVDKPLAGTAGEAQALVDHARARGLLLSVFQNRRWDGDVLTLRRLLADTRPLAQPDFRRLWLANIVTVIGAQLTVVAVPQPANSSPTGRSCSSSGPTESRRAR